MGPVLRTVSRISSPSTVSVIAWTNFKSDFVEIVSGVYHSPHRANLVPEPAQLFSHNLSRVGKVPATLGKFNSILDITIYPRGSSKWAEEVKE